MHGDGYRRVCPTCGASMKGRSDLLSCLELRGPRNITSSNIDRVLDDGGRRFLVIEEKRQQESIPKGQQALLAALAEQKKFTVWGVRGEPERLRISRIRGWRWNGAQYVLDALPIIEGAFDSYQAAVWQWFEESKVR